MRDWVGGVMIGKGSGLVSWEEYTGARGGVVGIEGWQGGGKEDFCCG